MIQDDYGFTINCVDHYAIDEDVAILMASSDDCRRINTKIPGVYELDAANTETGATMHVKVVLKNPDSAFTVYNQKHDDQAAYEWALMKKVV
jgi:hypothetical protein